MRRCGFAVSHPPQAGKPGINGRDRPPFFHSLRRLSLPKVIPKLRSLKSTFLSLFPSSHHSYATQVSRFSRPFPSPPHYHSHPTPCVVRCLITRSKEVGDCTAFTGCADPGLGSLARKVTLVARATTQSLHNDSLHTNHTLCLNTTTTAKPASDSIFEQAGAQQFCYSTDLRCTGQTLGRTLQHLPLSLASLAANCSSSTTRDTL